MFNLDRLDKKDNKLVKKQTNINYLPSRSVLSVIDISATAITDKEVFRVRKISYIQSAERITPTAKPSILKF